MRASKARTLTTAAIFRFHSVSMVCVPAFHKTDLQAIHARAKSLIVGIELQLVAVVRIYTEGKHNKGLNWIRIRTLSFSSVDNPVSVAAQFTLSKELE